MKKLSTMVAVFFLISLVMVSNSFAAVSVPEPGTMLLVGAGLIGLGVARKLFKK